MDTIFQHKHISDNSSHDLIRNTKMPLKMVHRTVYTDHNVQLTYYMYYYYYYYYYYYTIIYIAHEFMYKHALMSLINVRQSPYNDY